MLYIYCLTHLDLTQVSLSPPGAIGDPEYHSLLSNIKMNIFHVNIRRDALCFSQGDRMGYPIWLSTPHLNLKTWEPTDRKPERQDRFNDGWTLSSRKSRGRKMFKSSLIILCTLQGKLSNRVSSNMQWILMYLNLIIYQQEYRADM